MNKTKYLAGYKIEYKDAHFEAGKVLNSRHPENEFYFGVVKRGKREVWIEVTKDELFAFLSVITKTLWIDAIYKTTKKKTKIVKEWLGID